MFTLFTGEGGSQPFNFPLYPGTFTLFISGAAEWRSVYSDGLREQLSQRRHQPTQQIHGHWEEAALH